MNIRVILLFFIVSAATASTKLFVLGTGPPNPNPDRMGSSYLVLANDEPYLFDFGTGVIRRIAAFSPSWGGDYKELEVENIKHAFLTHIHSDHSAGLSDLILTPWVLGRDETLKIFGPRGIKDMVYHVTKAYELDIDYRINGSQPSNTKGYKSTVVEITEGLIFKNKDLSYFIRCSQIESNDR